MIRPADRVCVGMVLAGATTSASSALILSMTYATAEYGYPPEFLAFLWAALCVGVALLVIGGVAWVRADKPPEES